MLFWCSLKNYIENPLEIIKEFTTNILKYNYTIKVLSSDIILITQTLTLINSSILNGFHLAFRNYFALLVLLINNYFLFKNINILDLMFPLYLYPQLLCDNNINILLSVKRLYYYYAICYLISVMGIRIRCENGSISLEDLILY